MYKIITCTCDRPEAFELCKRYVLRQTIPYEDWIIVDGGINPIDPPKRCTYIKVNPIQDVKESIKFNILTAINQLKNYNGRILIFEDDDFYAPNYAEEILKIQTGLVGVGSTCIYNVHHNRYLDKITKDYTSFASLSFSKEHIPYLEKLCLDDIMYIDGRLCNHFGLNVIRNNNIFVSLKGLPGKTGYSKSHLELKTWDIDYDYSKLKQLLGIDYYNYINYSNIKELPRGVRRNGKLLMLPRPNIELEKLLDQRAIRIDNLKWLEIKHRSFESLTPIVKDKICCIVGKGPSLDNVIAEDFFDQPIFCINDSINKIVSLGLDNFIITSQHDMYLRRKCKYKRMILSPWAYKLYPDVTERYIIDRFKDLDFKKKGFLSVSVYIKMLQLLGVKKIRFFAFDSCKENPSFEYAKVIGYDSDADGKSKNRFKMHKDCIIKELVNTRYEFV